MLALPAFKSLSAGLGDTTSIIKSLTVLKYSDEIIRNDIIMLENYRNLAVNVVDPSEMGQQHLLNYCHHVKNCVNRLNGLDNLKLSFTWNDAFGINLKVTSSSLYLDYICCLWNLASFESLMGAKGDRSSEDGIRIANKHFQQSAGYLEYLRTNVLQYTSFIDNANKNLPTITDDGLTMAKNLMLAQAQLCFYEKAVKDKKLGNMKSVIIAKLAKQTSIFYASASVYCKVGILGMILDISWFAITDFQSKVFLGAAEYWQANASKEAALANGTGYGEEVARLKRADIHISQALGVSAKNPVAEGVVNSANGLRNAILEHKYNAEKDLQTVYMEAIPRETDLVEITPVAMVRPSALPELENTINAYVLFAYVLPADISSLNTAYSKSIATIYQKTCETSDHLTSYARSTLSTLGLPASLEAIKSQDPVPPSLWTKMERVKSLGGMERLKTMLDDLNSASRRALLSMGSIDESTGREERNDVDFRIRYPQYTGNSSKVAFSDIRSNNLRMREAYDNAQASDKQIEKELQSLSTNESFNLIFTSKQDLAKILSSVKVTVAVGMEPNLLDLDYHEGSNGSKEIDTTQLESKLHDMADVVEGRDKLVKALKEIVDINISEISSSIISSSINVNYLEAITALHKENLEKAQSINDEINKSLTSQEQILSDIVRLNDIFVKARGHNPIEVEKNRVIAGIDDHITKYMSIHAQMTAGFTFYSGLQSKLSTLQQSSDDAAYMQLWQRQEFENQLSTVVERSTQEQRDHEYAMSLQQQMLQQQPQQQQQQQQQSQPFQQTVSHPNQYSSGVPTGNNIPVYGTPVAGPPVHLMQPVMPPPTTTQSNAYTYIPASTAGSATTGMQPQISSSVPAQQYGQYPAMNAHQYPTASAQPQAYPTNTYNNATYPPALTASSSGTYMTYPAMPPPVQMAVQSPQSPLYPAANQPVVANYQVPQQYQQQQHGVASSQPAGVSALDMQRRIERLCEMGFPSDRVISALQVNNGNEEAALNSLLSASTVSTTMTASKTAPNTAPSTTAGTAKQKSGLFGKLWGSSS